MTIDVWMQHPTPRFLAREMFDSLRRWTGDAIPEAPPPIEVTVAAMDAGGVIGQALRIDDETRDLFLAGNARRVFGP